MSNKKLVVVEGGAAGMAQRNDFDVTLRLLAEAEVPEGLAGRVKARLELASGSKVIEWPREPVDGGAWLRRAAAAAIFLAVSGGSWAVYTAANGALEAARKGVAPAVLPSQRPGDFGTAGTMKKANPLMAPLVKDREQGPQGPRDKGTR